METKYPTMKRPKRKLNYITDKGSQSKKWDRPLTMVDVDKLFDDIDSPLNDRLPLSASFESSHTGTNIPKEDTNLSRPESCELDIDFDLPAERHRPVKTSSPIELDMGLEYVEKDDKDEEKILSPVLFNGDDDMAEELDRVSLPTETPKKKETGTKKGQENTELLDPVVNRESIVGISVNTSRAGEISSRSVKDKIVFLEKLHIQSSKKILKKAQVIVPPPPDPEDDFLILEDSASFWFSIPSKSVSKRKQRQSLTSSVRKESSADTGTAEIPSNIPQERPELEKDNSQLESQAVDQKNKKKKGKEKTQKLTGNGKIKDDLANYQEFSADDLLEQQEKEKKQQRFPSKKHLNAKLQSKDKSSEELDIEKPSEKMQTKERKSSDKRSAKDNKKTTKKSLEKTVKEAKKQSQRAVLEKDGTDAGSVTNQMQKESRKEPTDTEDLNLFSDAEVPESQENRKNERLQLPVESGKSSSEDTQKIERRKRKPVGQWWLSSERSEETPNQQPKLKKLKKNSKKPSTVVSSPVEADKQPVEHFSKQKSERKEKKTKRTKKKQNVEEVESSKSKATDELLDMEQQEIADQNWDQELSSPLMLTSCHKFGNQLFQKVYNNVCSAKMSTPSGVSNDLLCERESGKRRRKSPGDWWALSRADDDLERKERKPQPLHPKESNPCKANKQYKQRKPAELGVPQNGKIATPLKAAGGALKPLLNPLSPPKSVRRSLKDVFPAAAEPRHNVPSHSAKECSYSDFTTGNTFDKDITSEEVGKSIATRYNHKTQPNPKRQSDMLKALQSGPSSMIALEQYEDNDMSLPSSHIQPVLCVSDLCAPPLRTLTLHPKDRANLNEWLQALWSTTSDNGATVTAEHFEWYSYQDRALGFQVDLNSGSICSGKILLGSHMKKPLWVDHCATTVFNVLTSTIRVNIDSTGFCFRPGQSFIVECGRAYSLQNLNAEPAVLYFTRIAAENSD